MSRVVSIILMIGTCLAAGLYIFGSMPVQFVAVTFSLGVLIFAAGWTRFSDGVKAIVSSDGADQQQMWFPLAALTAIVATTARLFDAFVSGVRAFADTSLAPAWSMRYEYMQALIALLLMVVILYVTRQYHLFRLKSYDENEEGGEILGFEVETH